MSEMSQADNTLGDRIGAWARSAKERALQMRLIQVAGEAQALAASLDHSAFNVANALGAWLGGVVVSAGYGWQPTGAAGAGPPLARRLAFCISLAIARRRTA